MPRNDGSGLRLIIILLITLICLLISFYLMSKGYGELGRTIVSQVSSSDNPVAGTIVSASLSLLIVLILFYLIYDLYRAKRRGEPAGKIFGWYVFLVLIFGFAGSFNVFYGLFMRNELLRAEVEEKMLSLYNLKAEARRAIYTSQKIDGTLQDLMTKLEAQIKNINAPGWGRECDKILGEINAALEQRGRPRLTPYGRLSANLSGEDQNQRLNNMYAHYEMQIIGAKQSKFLDDLNNEIVDQKKTADKAVDNLDALATRTLSQIVNTYNTHAIEARMLTNGSFSTGPPLKVESAEVGQSITETFRSASQHSKNWGTWVSVFATLMINLFAPLFVLSFTMSSDSRAYSLGRHGAKNLS